VLAAILLMRDRGVRHSTTDSGEPSSGASNAVRSEQTLSLTLDFGDGSPRRYEPIAWREGMTVRDLTRETRREGLKLVVRGTGMAAFLESLDGVANEGADGRNWTYSVNGKRGDRSFAVYKLQPGDQVLWTFAGL
jgi:hypothetical protein